MQNKQSLQVKQSLSGAMVALVTPMHDHGEINWDQYKDLLDWHINIKTPGLVITGTTGESALLNAQETQQLWTMAAERCAGSDTLLVAGTGAISPQQVMTNNNQAAACGAQVALVVTPYYLRLTQQALMDHFWAIADASPIPILLYNVPSRTGNDLHTKTTQALAKHPNIIGIKEAKADMERIQQLAKINSFAVLSGDDDSFCQAMHQGAVGVISVAANVRPLTLQQICHAITLGDFGKARDLNQSLQSLYQLLSLEPNPGPIKAVMAAAKMLSSGIRRPLQLMSLNQTQLKQHLSAIKQEFTQA
ncbi:MAG: 4-hydroxy-tetrahydrodipicolinate synthase [Proteobacteria bacterium]|nr:MAG: 4-hydroxy-tetrahydrodipicolinate synthase [Pseudomonadota bacterium]